MTTTNSTIILMAGGTASGKTTIAQALSDEIGAVIIHHDRYYRNIPHPRGYNFDEPQALDNVLLATHLELLKQGLEAHLPIYDFPTHSRLPQTEILEPAPLIVVEGILSLASEEIESLGDHRIFVDAPDDIRLARRLKRDVVERGREVDGVLNQYMNTVRPMHWLHVVPSKTKAELILDGTAPISESTARIIALLRSTEKI